MWSYYVNIYYYRKHYNNLLPHWKLNWMKPNCDKRMQVIPQYSILPDSSQSNVVVEPSGFLEITNYTSQQLEEDSPMEQEVDSSNDEATAASPPDQP